MPAVQLARLRIQTTRLAESFDDPAEFARGLDSLLELYGNRAYRPGHNVSHRSRLPAYNVPPLVMQQLELQLGKVGSTDPEHCLQNIDTLWEAKTLEMREVAVFLLGEIPPDFREEILDRLKRWCDPTLDPALLSELFSTSGAAIRLAEPDIWLSFAADFLITPDPQEVILGLQALEPFLAETGLDYLPRIFNMLEPLVNDPPPAVMPALHDVLLQINTISPVETRSYLRKFLDANPKPAFLRLFRRLLPELPAETQAALRRYLRPAAAPLEPEDH
jgi:hypothetical protein